MPTIQYSARSARLSVHKLLTSCIRWGLVSRNSIVDDDWLPVTEWCQRYLPRCQPASFGEAFCTECIVQGNDFELIPTVKMETKNPIQGYFNSEFPAISNHCGVMAAWSRKTLKILEIFFRKTTFYGKIFKILFWKFSSRQRTTCCVYISWNLAKGKSVESCVTYLTKICLVLQLSLLRGSRPKSAAASSRLKPSFATEWY